MSGSAAPVVAFLAFVSSFVGAGLLTRLELLPDRPNQRSMHTKITPRSGGLALLLPFCGSAIAFMFTGGFSQELVILVAGAALFSLVGLADDAFQLSALVRLILQVAGASAVTSMAGAHSVDLFNTVLLGGPAAFAFQVFWVVLCVNFFNFMDGMDGLAGLQAFLFSLAAGLALLFSGDSILLGRMLLCLAASVAGFLCWNLRPSTLFMGDSGSYLLGFLIGFLPFVWSDAKPAGLIEFSRDRPAGGIDFTFGMILFAPFLLDAGFTVIRRLSERQNIFAAHRSHIYQLLRARTSTVRVLFVYAFLSGLFTILAYCRQRSTISGFESAALAVIVVVAAGFIYSALVRTLRPPAS